MSAMPGQEAREPRLATQEPAIDRETLVDLFQKMLAVRNFESRTSTLYRDGRIPGFVHVSLGQEASAVAVCSALRATDMITSNHRGHGHCMAKGVSPTAMFAELFGRADGVCRGRGGSMHIADPELGILGANGIVGAGLPIALGGAVASRLSGRDDVVVAFFGDGAVSQGLFHESINLAALWRLPVVFFCENNGYAEFTPDAVGHPADLRTRAHGYGVEYRLVNGTDVAEVYTVVTEVVGHARAGAGPVVVESVTSRWHGHYEGDAQNYRDKEDVLAGRARDPLSLARERLLATGLDPRELSAMEEAASQTMDVAVRDAWNAPGPESSTAAHFVVVDRTIRAETGRVDSSAEVKYIEAVRAALAVELETDDSVFMAGIDIGRGGGVFAVTKGLYERFPGRVLDTPISESAVMGVAVGAAMVGMRPVVEIMYSDFIGVCFDQILNQAAKQHYMTGGKAPMGLTIRTQFGAGKSAGAQHSQSLEAMLAHIPGLSVVMPSNSADAYGLLRASIQDPNPVVFLENRMLYGKRFPKPSPDHIVPIGKAALVRRGTDATIVAYSRMVHEALAAAQTLSEEGVDVEVLDLRTISPLDRAAILESVQRTSRLVVAHEAVVDFGVGAEIAAMMASDGFWFLDAPVERVGAQFTPAPYSPVLEQAWLPNRDQIAAAVRKTLSI